ncbi:hypothetical protein [Bradyrhizobium sp. URHD0069]|uniref:hypothetical protein n=1 Tax=Bradyrhizobium sp. URHD0069 TaxID=1380355 RepID=UPI0012DFCA85|nr:hypothetical protein [Bradyrhizobium sp. URHD0069]
MPESMSVATLTHDLLRKRSTVTLVWDDPEKMLALPVSFGCGLDRVQSEAAQAVRDLSTPKLDYEAITKLIVSRLRDH